MTQPGSDYIELPDDAHPTRRIEETINLAVRFGGNDGEWHKEWVIDQMVRILAGPRYEDVVADAKNGVDGPDTYEWKTGIAP